jgi:1-deoxy-D-xylulose-5-phosphate synthase
MRPSILDKVNDPGDLKLLPERELTRLAEEIRSLIIETTSVTGGHLASSLGAVELAIAVHRALDAPRDRIIWDVGHQAYAHKILTGRREQFKTLRQFGGISGFPRRTESEYDVVDSGHAGTAISYGLGLAIARDLTGGDYSVAAVIGDGSMTSGVAYEAMNQVGHHNKLDLLIILNDNEMSISQNVGGIASYLSRLRLKPGYTHLKEEIGDILTTMPALGDSVVRLAAQLKDSVTHALVPGVLFEALGLKYVGPIDGHNIAQVENTIREASIIDGPVLIHAVTQKGRGYDYSERRPEKFHGVSGFKISNGMTPKKTGQVDYTDVFAQEMVRLGEKDRKVVAITAAMKLGTGLDAFSRRFPDRFFDVGIAEQFAVNLAASFALGGLRPVVAIYSTFLQRAFDQLSQEICLQKLPVVIAVDRAGLVGADGATHHGYFDISYLRVLPNMTVMSPGSADELGKMLNFAINLGSPVAVRFPRGRAEKLEGVGNERLVIGRGEIVRNGDEVAILALGDMVSTAVETARILEERDVSAAVVNARFAKPIDGQFIREVVKGKKLVATIEHNVERGGFGSGVLELLNESRVRVPLMLKALPDSYVQHGKTTELLDEVGLTAASTADEIVDLLATL